MAQNTAFVTMQFKKASWENLACSIFKTTAGALGEY